MTLTDPEAIALALAAPFDASEVKFIPKNISGNRCQAIPYYDARTVQDRLDAVMGVGGWQTIFTPLPDGSVMCRILLKINGEWLGREDVGSAPAAGKSGDDKKAVDAGTRIKWAFSSALKRAASAWGVGRYVYHMKPQWVDYDPAKKQIVGKPVIPGATTRSETSKPAPVPQATIPPPRITKKVTHQQIDELVKLAASRGVTLASGAKLAARYGKATLVDLTEEDWTDAMDLYGKMPEKQLATH